MPLQKAPEQANHCIQHRRIISALAIRDFGDRQLLQRCTPTNQLGKTVNRTCDKISTEIEINAPQSTVWQTLTDFKSYTDWNPVILKATADFAVGSTIEFVEEIPDRGQFNIKARFTQIEPDRAFYWRGHYIAPFILQVNHYFILEPVDEVHTLFLHGQNQTGILVPLLSWQHHFERLQDAYILMNQALKVRCEGKI